VSRKTSKNDKITSHCYGIQDQNLEIDTRNAGFAMTIV